MKKVNMFYLCLSAALISSLLSCKRDINDLPSKPFEEQLTTIAATQDGITLLSNKGVTGIKLQNLIIDRAMGIMHSNRPYKFDGVQDCYGYVRQVWNPLLTDGTNHPEDFNQGSNYTSVEKAYWVGRPNGLPVNDAISGNWAAISSLDALLPGDVVGTTQGHTWGADVHYGLYGGKSGGVHYQIDCAGATIPGTNTDGARKRPWVGHFKYYYKPTHNLLAQSVSSGVRGDVGGNGKADLVTLFSNGNVYTYYGSANGIFSGSITSFNGTMNSALFDNSGHLAVDVVDVNGDRRADLVTASTDYNVYVFPGKPDGSFDAAVSSFARTYNANFWPIAVADVNGDGKGDLVSEYNGSVTVHPGRADNTFGAFVSSFSGTFNSAMKDGNGHYAIDVSDVNGDGYDDLVTAHTNGNVYTYTGKSNGRFNDAVASFANTFKLALSDGVGHEPIAVADVTGDGKADLVTYHFTTKSVSVFPGLSTGKFGSVINTFPGQFNSSLFNKTNTEFATVLDITGDGKADLVTANHGNGNVYVYPGQSDGTFAGGIANFNGTFVSARFNKNPGHEIASEKSVLRRRGCPTGNCF